MPEVTGRRKLNPSLAVLGGGLVVGALDGLYAVIASLVRGGDPTRVFKAVASGLIGSEAAFSGDASVPLGLVLHFVVATLIVLTYFLLARRFALLVRQPILLGATFGLVAYAVMNIMVIPLSAIDRAPLDFRPAVAGALVHVFLVGIPAALAARETLRHRVE